MNADSNMACGGLRTTSHYPLLQNFMWSGKL